MSDVLLDVEEIVTAYGQSQVLYGLDLEIRAGETVTLLGRNGMGMSSPGALATRAVLTASAST